MPVSVTCTPTSGSSFPVGRTTTTCVATDSLQRTDRCSFTVTVDAIPQLQFTRFVAFGDSITEGKLASGEPPQTPYPVGLQQMLASRYSGQNFTVVNAGFGAETTGGGVGRLPGVLAANNPQVLLLFEGVNDLAAGGSAAIGPMISSLGNMAGTARGRGVLVMLATLLPEIFGAQRAGAAPFIVPANDAIRVLAGSQGIALVDLYAAFQGSESTLIGFDGLHPSEAGYQKIAQTFFEAIRRYEGAPNPTFTDFAFSLTGVRRKR
jgi:lysophospholipase L1-like esterase